MFEIDQTPLKRGFSPMPAGTNNNCVLTRVSYEPFKKDGTGDHVLKFEFSNDRGQTFTHNEWEIVPDRVKQNAAQWGKDYKDLLDEMLLHTTERIKHIMSCFMPLNEIHVKGANYKEFSQAVIDNLGDKFVDVPVRLKLVLNNKDYTKFPKRAINDFITLMSQPDTFEYHEKYDRITPKTPASGGDLDDMLDGPVMSAAVADTPEATATPTAPEDDSLVF